MQGNAELDEVMEVRRRLRDPEQVKYTDLHTEPRPHQLPLSTPPTTAVSLPLSHRFSYFLPSSLVAH